MKEAGAALNVEVLPGKGGKSFITFVTGSGTYVEGFAHLDIYAKLFNFTKTFLSGGASL